MLLFITPRWAIDRSGYRLMLTVPPELTRRYAARLTQQAVPHRHRPYYLRWLRYYWDFCHKYALNPTDRSSLPAFEEKLRARNQSDFQRQQARQAVSLFYEAIATARSSARQPPGDVHGNDAGDSRSEASPAVLRPVTTTGVRPTIVSPRGPRHDEAAAPQTIGQAADVPRRTQTSPVQPVSETRPRNPANGQLTGASWESVYDGLKSAVAVRHYSPKTLHA